MKTHEDLESTLWAWISLTKGVAVETEGLELEVVEHEMWPSGRISDPVLPGKLHLSRKFARVGGETIPLGEGITAVFDPGPKCHGPSYRVPGMVVEIRSHEGYVAILCHFELDEQYEDLLELFVSKIPANNERLGSFNCSNLFAL